MGARHVSMRALERPEPIEAGCGPAGWLNSKGRRAESGHPHLDHASDCRFSAARSAAGSKELKSIAPRRFG